MKKWYKIAAAGLCAVMLLATPVQAQAAKGDKDSYRAVFDADYYYNTYTDLQTTIGLDADKLFDHFVQFGLWEGRSGSSEFNLRAYMKNNQDLLSAFGADYGAYCRHYIDSGRNEGRIAAAEGTSNELGSYSSGYEPSEQRAINIELAASRINGIVLQPGDSFSFSKSVLSRTEENGYVMGPSYAAGREVESIGGGICQVSSTLYVAMVLAGIQPTERYTHSAQVDYVPLGLDATIAENSKDLKFVNTLPYAISISAVTENGELTVSLNR